MWAQAEVEFANVVDVSSLGDTLLSGAGPVFAAAVGVALAFLLARKLAKWMFGATGDPYGHLANAKAQVAWEKKHKMTVSPFERDDGAAQGNPFREGTARFESWHEQQDFKRR
jgi:hypothetical protein